MCVSVCVICHRMVWCHFIRSGSIKFFSCFTTCFCSFFSHCILLFLPHRVSWFAIENDLFEPKNGIQYNFYWECQKVGVLYLPYLRVCIFRSYPFSLTNKRKKKSLIFLAQPKSFANKMQIADKNDHEMHSDEIWDCCRRSQLESI